MVPPVNLRNRRSFPTYASCPDENEVNTTYYGSNDGFVYEPKRHWCLFAEIMEVETFLRPRLVVRDRSGQKFIVAFYLDNNVTFDPTGYQRGNTIAILYPDQHQFLDSTVGIRQEDLKSVQVSRQPAMHRQAAYFARSCLSHSQSCYN